jgi:hypothetical protein
MSIKKIKIESEALPMALLRLLFSPKFIAKIFFMEAKRAETLSAMQRGGKVSAERSFGVQTFGDGVWV